MAEIWLRPNRRAIGFATVPPLLVGALGAWLAVGPGTGGWTQWVGGALFLVAIVTIAMLLVQLARPRIAYRDGHVLFYLRAGWPIAVPARTVEAFFLGQGPAGLPANIPQHAEAVNLVARLSQRETDWARRDVKPALGGWCNGYVTIRGTWCEPLNHELVRQLNRRLKEVQQCE
jgi:hypothetical protein